MISVENRIPELGREGRVKIARDDGSTISGVLSMDDNPYAPGTPWNRRTAQLLQGDIRTYPAAEGQSIAIGDVVNVSDGKVRQDIVAAASEEVGLVSYYAQSYICLLDNNLCVEASTSGSVCTINLLRVTGSKVPISIVSTLCLEDVPFSFNGGQIYNIAALSPTSFVMIYANGTSTYCACVYTVDGETITQGEAVSITSGITPALYDNLTAVRMSETRVMVCYSLQNHYNLHVQILDIDGTAITPHAISAMPTDSNIGSKKIEWHDTCLISGGNTGSVFVAARTVSAYKTFCLIVSADADGTPVFGTPVLLPDTTAITPYCVCNGTEAAVLFSYQNVLYAYGFSISGDTLSVGDKVTLTEESIAQSSFSLTLMGGQMFVVFVGDTASSAPNMVHMAPLLVDDLTVSMGEPTNTLVRMKSVYSKTAIQTDSTHLLVTGRAYGGNTVLSAATIEFRDGQIAGRWVVSSYEAIALNAATEGQNCDVIFSGMAEAPGLTAGTRIESDGVQGYVPQDGVLAVSPWWEYQQTATVTGSYTGDGAESQSIDLGFAPRAVLTMTEAGVSATYSGSHPAVYGGLVLPNRPVNSDGSLAIRLTETGFEVFSSGSYVKSNLSGYVYHYIALR